MRACLNLKVHRVKLKVLARFPNLNYRHRTTRPLSCEQVCPLPPFTEFIKDNFNAKIHLTFPILDFEKKN